MVKYILDYCVKTILKQWKNVRFDMLPKELVAGVGKD